MVYFLAFVIFGYFAFCIGRSIWSMFDHSVWRAPKNPDINAEIVNVNVEKVRYSKNDAKYKTTVIFSDGFNFITHRTNRDDHFMSYTITIDNQLKIAIINTAVAAHIKAVNKMQQRR